jgi:hypothetical protein
MKQYPIFCFAAVLLFLSGCSGRHQGVFYLRWIEQPQENGPSAKADPKDQVKFTQLLSYDKEEERLKNWTDFIANLQEGDVLAFRLDRWEADRDILCGNLNHVPYRICQYGHLAILVKDPANPKNLVIFSSQGFKGPNIADGLDTLKDLRWDVYRLNQAKRIDFSRLDEFVAIARAKGERWDGYDFVGMFGLWNSELHPDKPEKVGQQYICSTVVLAALHYAGVALDADHRKGIADVVTPFQVVSSKGQIIPLPKVTIEVSQVSQQ